MHLRRPIADVSIAGGHGNLPSWLPLAALVILLSIASESLAFTAAWLVSISHALGLSIQGSALTASAILNFGGWKGVRRNARSRPRYHRGSKICVAGR